MRHRWAQRSLLVLAALHALWAALSLLDILPFTINLGDWTYWRFFAADWLGGVLWAGQATLCWGAALLAREGRLSHRQVRLIAGAHAALAALTLAGGSTMLAVLPGAVAAFSAVIAGHKTTQSG